MHQLLRLPAKRLEKYRVSISLDDVSKFFMANYTWAGRPIRGMADDPGFTSSGSDPIENTPAINFMPLAWSPQLLALMYGQSVADFLTDHSMFSYTGRFAKPGTPVRPMNLILYCPGHGGIRTADLLSYLTPIAADITAKGILVADINPTDLLSPAAGVTKNVTSPIIKMFLPPSDIQVNSEGVPYPVVDQADWLGMNVLHLDFCSDYEFTPGGGPLVVAVPYDGTDLGSGAVSSFPDLMAKHTTLVQNGYPRYTKYGYFCPYYLDPNFAYTGGTTDVSGQATVDAFAAALASYGVECPTIGGTYDAAAVGLAFRNKVVSFFGL